MQLCGGPAVHLFSATELERLVCGNPNLDFDALQAAARYDGGYNAESRVRLIILEFRVRVQTSFVPSAESALRIRTHQVYHLSFLGENPGQTAKVYSPFQQPAFLSGGGPRANYN